MTDIPENPTPEKISGYALAEHLFSRGGVRALLQHAGRTETDWLELKAGMGLLPEDVKKGETQKDLYWNIAKEIIALANTSGGAVVIGVKDHTLDLVPLTENDPLHKLDRDVEAYIREFVRPNLWPAALSWTYRGKIWELKDKMVPAEQLAWYHATYSDSRGVTGEVVVILVQPFERVLLTRSEGKYSSVFYRMPGDVGEAVPVFDYDAIDEYRNSREVERAYYAGIRDRFDQERESCSAASVLRTRVAAYYAKLREEARDRMAVFTQLDAEENIFDAGEMERFYSPDAVESFEDDDTWLDEDDEDVEPAESEDDPDCDDEDESEEENLDESRTRETRKGALLDILKSEHRVVVSGEPGGGKTTCLTYFTLQFSGDAEDVLAVFVPMGQWRVGGSLEAMIRRATGLDIAQLVELAESGRLRLVIDAVNECPDNFRSAAIQNISVFLSEHPSVPAVISTRDPVELSVLGLPVFHVQPMDEEHRRRFLERYLGDTVQADLLLRQIGTLPGGETIAENPMLLRLVVEVYRESPSRRLPVGRAGLYRRSLRSWYKRERAKANKAGVALPWRAEEALRLLATLAYESRLRGFRDVPLETVREVWGNEAEEKLDRLCQGPVVCRDDEFVRFRHETFQEYLCAEHIVRNLVTLPDWTRQDYDRWGMPLAYAVELLESEGQSLPEPIWCAAWALNPWLGVALTGPQTAVQLLRGQYRGRVPQVKGLSLGTRSNGVVVGEIFLQASLRRLGRTLVVAALEDARKSWYRRSDVVLRYMVSASRACWEGWRAFELSQIQLLGCLRVGQAIVLAQNWLLLGNPREVFQFHAPEKWDQWIEHATPELALALIGASIAEVADFRNRKREWQTQLEPSKYIQLFRHGIYTVEEIREMVPGWITRVDRAFLAELLLQGLVSPDEVRNARPDFLKKIQIDAASRLIAAGTMCREDFSERVASWIRKGKIKCLLKLLRYGLATDEEVREKLDLAIDECSAIQASNCIRGGYATPLDFRNAYARWVSTIHYSQLHPFVRNYGECGLGEMVRDNLDRFIGPHTSPQSARGLIVDGYVPAEKFAPFIAGWKRVMALSEWPFWVDVGLASHEEYESLKALESAALNACQSVKSGKATPSDFSKDVPAWLAGVRPSTVKKMGEVGLIELAADPWDSVADRYPVGSRVKGKVVNLASYGAFVEIAPGIQGMVHVSEFSWQCKPTDARESFKIGDEITAQVISIDAAHQKIALSIRQMTANPWDSMADRYPVGSCVKGKVANLIKYGAFVEIAPGIQGLVHVSELSWTRKLMDARKCLKIGDEITAQVLSIDIEHQKIALSIRQMQENPWDSVQDRYPVGSRVKGKVSKLVSFGAFIELKEGVDGLVHISQISNPPIEQVKGFLQIGQEVEARVIKVDREHCRIGLSMIAVGMDESAFSELLRTAQEAEAAS